MGLDYLLRRRGPLTMAPSQLGLFARSSADVDRADLQFHIQPLSLGKFGEPMHTFPAFTSSVCTLRPTSRGQVSLRSAALDAAPVIAPNYLATDADRTTALRSIRLARRIAGSPALARYRPVEFLPGPAVGDDEEALVRAAGDIGTTIFHPVGTARMGRRRSWLGRRRKVAGSRRGRAAGCRCLGDALHHLGQHQLADDHDRRESQRHDS
jgi:choline dehydrogenase